MTSKIIFIVIVIMVIISGAAALICLENLSNNEDISPKQERTCIGDVECTPAVCFQAHCFEVELAMTDRQRAQGLMFRQKLAQNKGMLFVFETPATYIFWMKNTLIPLDIIWLDENQKIIFMSLNTQPCQKDTCQSIGPDKDAQYVLEINAGIADQSGMKIGDRLEFKNI